MFRILSVIDEVVSGNCIEVLVFGESYFNRCDELKVGGVERFC